MILILEDRNDKLDKIRMQAKRACDDKGVTHLIRSAATKEGLENLIEECSAAQGNHVLVLDPVLQVPGAGRVSLMSMVRQLWQAKEDLHWLNEIPMILFVFSGDTKQYKVFERREGRVVIDTTPTPGDDPYEKLYKALFDAV
jgi:hypothetical protein